MGQRLQVYIHVYNPLHKLVEKQKSLKKHHCTGEETEALQKQIQQYKYAFGTAATTIISYHNQWCYGRSALIGAWNILNVSKNASEYNNPFNKEFSLTGTDFLNCVTHLLSLYTCKLSALISRTGFEYFHLLNFNDPEIRINPLRGDNNDGIIVIDTIKNAYSFVNLGIGDSTVSQLPILQPLTAEQYVRVYYPQSLEDSKTSRLPEDIQEHVTFYANNTRINKLFIKPFNTLRLLTIEELKKMFPLCYEEANVNSNRND
jgi:hypothetical protein